MADLDLHEVDLQVFWVIAFPNLHQFSKFLLLDISEISEEFNETIICLIVLLKYWIKREINIARFNFSLGSRVFLMGVLKSSFSMASLLEPN